MFSSLADASRIFFAIIVTSLENGSNCASPLTVTLDAFFILAKTLSFSSAFIKALQVIVHVPSNTFIIKRKFPDFNSLKSCFIIFPQITTFPLSIFTSFTLTCFSEILAFLLP